MARHKDIADALRSKIQRGDYPRGSALPSQPTLSTEYGVSEPVIGRAITTLRQEGFLRVQKGRGAVVNEIPTILRNAVARYTKANREEGASRGAFATEVRRLGHTPRSTLVQTGPVTPPPEIASLLRLDAGDVAAIRKRHMLADDTPVQVATSYIPWSIAGGTVLTEEDTGPGGTYSRLEEMGHRVTRMTELITVRPPTDAEAEFLLLGDGQPVYSVDHVAWTADQRPVEVTVHVMPTHQWQLEYEWPVD